MTSSKRSPGHALHLTDLKADPRNANRGTDRGRAALARSLRESGPGRAVLIDRHGTVIAGNKTVEQAKRLQHPAARRQDRRHVSHRGPARRSRSGHRSARESARHRRQPRRRTGSRVGRRHAESSCKPMGSTCRRSGPTLSSRRSFAEPTTGLTDENAVVEPGPTDIVRGELFALGRHRLLCGDATSAGDVRASPRRRDARPHDDGSAVRRHRTIRPGGTAPTQRSARRSVA